MKYNNLEEKCRDLKQQLKRSVSRGDTWRDRALEAEAELSKYRKFVVDLSQSATKVIGEQCTLSPVWLLQKFMAFFAEAKMFQWIHR